jgi:predicted transcriptional regulator YdeE
MRIIDRDESAVIGLEVIASFRELRTAVPAAWNTLFTRVNDLPKVAGVGYAEASRYLGEARYREVVGVEVKRNDPLPDLAPGLGVTVLPAGRYVHHRHEGRVEDIADGFQAIYDWAAANGFSLGEYKLDIGYSADGTERPHHLYVNVTRGGAQAL